MLEPLTEWLPPAPWPLGSPLSAEGGGGGGGVLGGIWQVQQGGVVCGRMGAQFKWPPSFSLDHPTFMSVMSV